LAQLWQSYLFMKSRKEPGIGVLVSGRDKNILYWLG
jgi:hypothetical protein